MQKQIQHLRHMLTFAYTIGCALMLIGCSDPDIDLGEIPVPPLTVCEEELSRAEDSRRSCKDNLLQIEKRLQNVEDEYQRVREDLQRERDAKREIQKDLHNVENEYQRIRDDLQRELEENKKLRGIFEQLDREVEKQSFLLQTPNQLKVLETKEIKRLQRYREAERDLEHDEQSSECSSWSSLFSSCNSIEWEPEYLRKRISEVKSKIMLIRYSQMLIFNQGTVFEDLF